MIQQKKKLTAYHSRLENSKASGALVCMRITSYIKKGWWNCFQEEKLQQHPYRIDRKKIQEPKENKNRKASQKDSPSVGTLHITQNFKNGTYVKQ